MPRGRPKGSVSKTIKVTAPKEHLPSSSPTLDPRSKRKRLTASDKDRLQDKMISKKMRGFILDMFNIYEKQHGKDSMLHEVKTDPKFASIFIKEFFGYSKKYMDMEIAKLKIYADTEREKGVGGGAGNGGGGPTFIIMGLHNVPPHVQEQLNAQKALEDGKTVEAKFVTVGLD